MRLVEIGEGEEGGEDDYLEALAVVDVESGLVSDMFASEIVELTY